MVVADRRAEPLGHSLATLERMAHGLGIGAGTTVAAFSVVKRDTGGVEQFTRLRHIVGITGITNTDIEVKHAAFQMQRLRHRSAKLLDQLADASSIGVDHQHGKFIAG